MRNLFIILIFLFSCSSTPQETYTSTTDKQLIIPVESTVRYEIKDSNESIIYDTTEISADNFGFISYNVPDSMKLGEHYKVTLRITKKPFSEVLITKISKDIINTTTIINKLQMSDVMSAELIDSEGSFIINSLSTEKQIIEGDYTEWTWDILPNKKGNLNLRMVIKINIYNDKGEFVKDIPVFERDIYTSSNLYYSIKNFLTLYWQWILSTLILPLIVYIWKKKSNK